MALLDPTFDDRDGQIWFDGALVPWRDAKVHVLTHALHYASAVFEGLRCYGGVPFALSQHSQRLIDSARLLGFDLPWSCAANRCRGQRDRRGQRPDRLLHPADRVARVRADGRRRAED